MELLSIKQASQALGITYEGMRLLLKTSFFDPKKVITVNKPITRIYKSEIDRLLKARGGKGKLLPHGWSKRPISQK